MKEQLISFETAKLAKEKGFDFGLWKDFETHRDGWEGVMNNSVYCPMSAKYPTQSLLQKWLREVHDINVYCVCRVGRYRYWIDKISPSQEDVDYEEALEIGLQEGLKLIS